MPRLGLPFQFMYDVLNGSQLNYLPQLPRDKKNTMNSQERLPEFRPVMEAYYAGLLALGKRLLRLMALTLDLPEDWLLNRFTEPLAILRPLHYSAKISRPENV